MPRCNGKAVPQVDAQQAIFIAVDASDLVATQSGEKRNTLIILFALRRSCWQAYCHSSGIAAICARASFYKMK